MNKSSASDAVHTASVEPAAQMIARLLELANRVREAKGHGEELGLTDEKTAFCDALAENGSAKEVMKSDQVRLMAPRTGRDVNRMPKLDWTQRESLWADLRRKVRRFRTAISLSERNQLVLRRAERSTKSAE